MSEGGRAAPFLVEMLDFHRKEGGSFIPMISAVLAQARQRGWRTGVVAFSDARDTEWANELEAQGAELMLAPTEVGRSRRQLGDWLGTALPDDGPAVMHSHFHGFDVAGWKVRRSRPDSVLLWHIHSTYARDPAQIAWTTYKLAWLGRHVDAFLCPAQNIVDSTVRRGARRSRVHLEPTAIDPSAFPVGSPDLRAEAREGLGLPQDALVLLHFGWHWELKGGDVFLETVKELAGVGLPGLVALERGGDADRYEPYAASIGVSDHLRMCPPVDDIGELHRAADVLVSSSRTEGMAYATLEALCSGTPVVATDIPGHSYVGREVAACRITGHSPADIAAGVRETISRSPESVAAEATAARSWIESNLSTEARATAMVDRYERLLKERS